MDDTALVRQVLGGNRDAFKFLVIRYQKPLFKFIAAFGFPEAVVDELAQDAFVKAYKNLASFDAQKSSFSSWVFTIAKNSALNEKAKSKVRVEKLTMIWTDTATSHSADPESIYETKEAITRVRESLQAIPKAFRSAVALSYLHDLSLEEVAAIEQCSVGTVKSRIFRGKGLLRSLLIGREAIK